MAFPLAPAPTPIMSLPALPHSASFPAESISPVTLFEMCLWLCPDARRCPPVPQHLSHTCSLPHLPFASLFTATPPPRVLPPTLPQAGTQQGPAQRSPHAWTGSLCVCGTPLSSFGGRAAFGPCCLLSCSAPALGVWAQRALTSRRPSGREVTRGSEQGNEWAALARVLRLPSPPCGLVLGCRRKNSKGG